MAKKTDDLAKIIVVYNTEDADMISSLLMMERIPCVRKKDRSRFLHEYFTLNEQFW